MHFRLLNNDEVRLYFDANKSTYPVTFFVKLPVTKYFLSGGRFGRQASLRLTKAFAYFLAAKHNRLANKVFPDGPNVIVGYYRSVKTLESAVKLAVSELPRFYKLSLQK